MILKYVKRDGDLPDGAIMVSFPRPQERLVETLPTKAELRADPDAKPTYERVEEIKTFAIDEKDAEYKAFKNRNNRTDGENAMRQMMGSPFFKQWVKYEAAKENKTVAEIRQAIKNA